MKTKESSDKNKISEVKKTFISIIKADSMYNEASKIFLWTDLVRTGLIFGVINAFYFLLEFYDYTVVTLISYLALALALVCFSYTNFVILKSKWIQGKEAENPFLERFKNIKFHISPQSVSQHCNTIVDILNLAIDNMREIFYCINNTKTGLWIFYFYLIATVGSWFGGATLLYLISLILFIWPRLYQEKQKEIDHFYGIALTETDKYLQLALSKIPPNISARFPLLAPREKKKTN